MSKIINIESKDQLQKELSGNDKVLLDFWAPWCGPCRMLAPTLETIADDNNGITVLKVNTDENQDIAQEYGIRSIPTMKMFQAGKEVNTMVGASSKESILKAFV